jgi:hypothetical protein
LINRPYISSSDGQRYKKSFSSSARALRNFLQKTIFALSDISQIVTKIVKNMPTVKVNPQYITDNAGKKISVVLPIRDFKAIMEELEELEEVRMYDEAKKSGEPSIPIDEAFKMIETKRKAK